MTTTTDEAALLRAIALEPADDNVRLVYADWLDENAGECPQCEGTGWERVADSAGDMDDQPCRECRGAGVDFRHERAEFIRLQIALAGPDSELPKCVACNGTKRVTVMAYPEAAYDPEPHTVETDCTACICPVKYVKTGTNRNAMTARVSELWWKSVSKQFALYGVSSVQRIHGEYTRDTNPSLTVTRGFAETLYLPTLADLCEREKCRACHGRGHNIMSHPIDGRPERVACIRCLGTPGDYTGKPTELALDAIRAHPTITRVVVGDRRPWHFIESTGYWNWVASPNCVNNCAVIQAILTHLPKSVNKSEQAALDALAVAAGQWLRQEAGI